MKQLISKRQYFILSIFMTRVLFIGGGFTLLIGIERNNILLSSFLGMLLGYFLLYLFYKKGSINKWCSCVISMAVLITGILASSTLTGTFLLYKTPTLLIVISFIAVLLYGGFKEITVPAQISEIIMPVALFIILCSCVALIYLVDLSNLWPMFNTSFINFIKGIGVFAFTSLIPNLLLLDYQDKMKFKDIGMGYIAGCLINIVILFFIISIYGVEFARILRFPEYLVLKKINFFNFISNVENLLVMEWIVNLLIGGMVCIKVLVDNCHKVLTLVGVAILVTFNELVLQNDYINILYFKNYIYYFYIVLVLVSLLWRRKKVS